MNWKLPLAAAAVVVAVSWLVPRDEPPPPPAAEAAGLSAPRVIESMMVSHAGGRAAIDPARVAAVSLNAPLDARSQAVLAEFDRLRLMPAGDAAIAFAQKLEAGATVDSLPGYIQALLTTSDPSVERTAIAAIARVADAATIVGLAENYGAIAAENRGRILQVLERAENPAAVDGLAAVVAADDGERRSPLAMSSLYGIANTGSMQGVQYLLGQLATDNADFAVMALGRVSSPQGVEMIRAAAEGSKDSDPGAQGYQPALRRIAETASAR